MEKTSKTNIKNKKEKNIANKKSILKTYSASILKFNIAIALFFTIMSFVVYAGDVIVENGKIDVDNKLYVDDNGNVGVGTTLPSYKLHVAGGDAFSSGYVRGNTGLCIGADCRTSWPSGGSGSLPSGTSGQTLRHDGTNWIANSLLFNDGDNIEVQKNNEVYLNVKNTESGGRQYAIVSAGSAGGIGVGKFSIYDKTADASRLTVDANGNVGIGTMNPGSNKLDVAGNIHSIGDVCTDAGGGKCLSTGGGSQWTTSSSNIYYNTGNVGIGTANPAAKLDVAGTILGTGGRNAVYEATNPKCSVGMGTLTRSATCGTSVCSSGHDGDMSSNWYVYWTCAGACAASSPEVCSNTFIGYLH